MVAPTALQRQPAERLADEMTHDPRSTAVPTANNDDEEMLISTTDAAPVDETLAVQPAAAQDTEMVVDGEARPLFSVRKILFRGEKKREKEQRLM